jgi:hypothetical protein
VHGARDHFPLATGHRPRYRPRQSRGRVYDHFIDPEERLRVAMPRQQDACCRVPPAGTLIPFPSERWVPSRSAFRRAPPLDGLEHHLDAQTQNCQVQQHLTGGDEACDSGVGGDVAEADGGEDGDGEVQRVGPGERFTERARILRAQDVVGRREEQKEQGRGGRKGLDRPDAGIACPDNRPKLPGDEGTSITMANVSSRTTRASARSPSGRT